MEEKKLDLNQALAAMITFLYSIHEHCKERLSADGYEQLMQFLSAMDNGDPATPSDWKECYKRTFGRPFVSKNVLKADQPCTVLTIEEVFTMINEFCAFFNYKFGFFIQETRDILYLMRAKPDENKKECELWQRAVQGALESENLRRVY